MRVRIIAVGKLREPHYRSAADVYLGRLKHVIGVEEVEVREARKTERHNPERGVAAEADSLLGALPASGTVVVMDERGRQESSEALAAFIESQMVYGRDDLSFVIGGALGLDERVRQRADKVLALSKMTLPHELARVVLVEQLYRAMTILRGEPYHK